MRPLASIRSIMLRTGAPGMLRCTVLNRRLAVNYHRLGSGLLSIFGGSTPPAPVLLGPGVSIEDEGRGAGENLHQLVWTEERIVCGGTEAVA